ncbi:MAG: PIN domain-containing protein [Flavobacteriales bacterium]|jgi:predicted nucleic acid-binding protein|nr:PIN domain-containing protein [Flavobacteriales bacterium]MBK6892019.1 PIN domain-containing protein [Flavobacteriales bacterium]MBK7246158.1 PIN domain-containing protein [Flavobacteriales bacterium]MBK7286276.1 PIN domain-containing protein [Flavobacteriales bacterium]MBK9060076.1 PIN domain-containing protein [Flavobacteriales bacterium]
MTAERLLADTNALIHQLGGDQRVGDLLKDKKVHISFVTQIELLSWPGYTAKERAVVAEQIQEFIIMDATERVKMIAIDLRIRHKLKLADALIAATAIA